MKKLLILTSLVFVGCSSSPHKAKKIDTELENSHGSVSGETVGVNKDGDMVIQKKLLLSENLRSLQYEVYGLEDRVYGSRKYGSKGLYGVLKNCRMKLSLKANGGTGKLRWTEPMDRVTDKEEDFRVGVDENDKLVAVSEEYINDRIKRFKGYRKILIKRQDEYEEKVAICKAELKSRQHDQKTQ